MFKDQTKDIASGRVRLQKIWSNLRTFCQVLLDGFQWAVVDAATNRKWLFGICHFVLMPSSFLLLLLRGAASACLLSMCGTSLTRWPYMSLSAGSNSYHHIWMDAGKFWNAQAVDVSDACSCLYERDGWFGVVLCCAGSDCTTRPDQAVVEWFTRKRPFRAQVRFLFRSVTLHSFCSLVVWLRTKQMHRFQIASYEQTHVEISLFRLYFLQRDRERDRQREMIFRIGRPSWMKT